MSIRPSLTKLNDKTEGPALFAVHSAGGTAFHYARIALMLESQCPVIGIESSGLELGDEVQQSVEDMAASYVGLIVEAQPSGPYVLTGYSAGARIAYEMAVRLRELGHEVAAPVLLGGGGPSEPETSGPLDDARIFHSFIHYSVEEFRQLSATERDRHILEVCAEDFAVDLDKPEDEAFVRRRIAVYEANSRAMLTHRISTFSGDIVLVESEDEVEAHDYAQQWGELVDGSVTLEVVPGGHVTMVLREANQRAMADVLSRSIKDVAGR